MLLHIDELNFEKGRNTTGQIYFNFSGEYFPEEGWNDFVEIILNWWSNELFDFFTDKATDHCCLTFMDGSFDMNLFKVKDSNSLEAVLICDEIELKRIRVDENSLLKSMILALHQVMRESQNRNILTKEGELMQTNFTRLVDLRNSRSSSHDEKGS